MKTLVSFVIPCYRSEATLPGVIREIQDTMEKMKDYGYEIVLVNDCSPDGTFPLSGSCVRKMTTLSVLTLPEISDSTVR